MAAARLPRSPSWLARGNRTIPARAARGASALIAVALAGCSLRFDIPPQQAAPPTIINAHPGEIVQTRGPAEVVETPAAPQCFARARLFRGLVQTDCAELAKEVRP